MVPLVSSQEAEVHEVRSGQAGTKPGDTVMVEQVVWCLETCEDIAA